jgi:hypothetical protein
MTKLAIMGGNTDFSSPLTDNPTGVEPNMVYHITRNGEPENINWPEFSPEFSHNLTGKRRKHRCNNGAFGKCKAKNSH